MPRYDHNKCDGCGNDFRPEDDIVVCPVCGTPQHRACWNQNHACVNAHRHGEGFVWEDNSPQSNESEDEKKTITCPRCGEKSGEGTLFCPRCGQPLSLNEQQGNPYGQTPPFGGAPFGGFPPYGEGDPNAQGGPYGNGFFGAPMFFNPYGGVPPEEKIDDVPVPEVAQAVQVNSQFYIPRFKKMEKGSKLGWNWGAFFFGHIWYFYRKNFAFGLIYALVEILISVISAEPMQKYLDLVYQLTESPMSNELLASMSALMPKMMLLSTVTILVRVGFTLVSNYVYKRKVMSIISSAREQTQNTEEYQEHLQAKGGASILFGCLSYVGLTVLANIMMAIVQVIIK